MTEDEAIAWIGDRFGDGAVDRLRRFGGLVQEEAKAQNLVAASTLPHLWVRHMLDSAQLLPLADTAAGPWLDIGSGAGFPGVVIAILGDLPVILCEPRRRRATFLQQVVSELSLPAHVEQVSVVNMAPIRAGVISARAVASLDKLFEIGAIHSGPQTLWLLSKGASVATEVAQARRNWNGTFHVEHSLSDPHAGVVVAREVRRR